MPTKHSSRARSRGSAQHHRPQRHIQKHRTAESIQDHHGREHHRNKAGRKVSRSRVDKQIVATKQTQTLDKYPHVVAPRQPGKTLGKEGQENAEKSRQSHPVGYGNQRVHAAELIFDGNPAGAPDQNGNRIEKGTLHVSERDR